MHLADDFWLQLHLLDLCVEADGHERLSKIVAAWEAMPPVARDVSVAELSHLLAELGKLRPMVAGNLHS